MSVAVEASSSQAPAASPLPAPPQAGDRAGGASQAPPQTLFKQKVKWSWASYAGERGAQRVRLLSWDGNDTSRVRGDDSEEPPETDRQRNARVDEEAHQSGLQEDLLLHDNDIVREQVRKAADGFVADSVLMAEEVDGHERVILEEVLGNKGKFGTRTRPACVMADGLRRSSRINQGCHGAVQVRSLLNWADGSFHRPRRAWLVRSWRPCCR